MQKNRHKKDYNYSAWDIFVVTSNGTNLRRLNPNQNINNCHPCWSPDGQLILYVNYASSIHGLYTMNPDGSNNQLFLDDPTYMEDYPDWR